jgi:basic membrane protein A
MRSDRRRILTALASGTALGILLGAAAPATAQEIKVGILVPGSQTDKGFMQSAFGGAKKVEQTYGAKGKVQLIENINYADMEQAVTQLASDNKFVVSVSGASQAAMTKVSKRFPDVKFNLVGGAKISEATNMAQYDMRQAEINFISGAVAAMSSKSGTVSFVAGLEIPGVVNASKEFAKGAKYARPDIKTIVVFTGSFDDVAKAKEATLATISQGADVHVHVMNKGLPGIEQAAREKGTRMIGGPLPACGSDPLYIAYSRTGVGYLVEYAVKAYVGGTWKPGPASFGLKAGPEASDMVLCGTPDPAIKAKVEDIKKAIIAGQIVTLDG